MKKLFDEPVGKREWSISIDVDGQALLDLPGDGLWLFRPNDLRLLYEFLQQTAPVWGAKL